MFDDFSRLYKYCVRHASVFVVSMVGLFVASTSTILLISHVGTSMDVLAVRFSDSETRRHLVQFFELLALVGFSTAIRHYYVSIFGDLVVRDIRRDLFKSCLTLNLDERRLSGELVARITDDCRNIESLLAETLSLALRNLVTLFVSILILLYIDVYLLLLTLVVVPFAIGVLVLFGRRVGEKANEVQKLVGLTTGFVSNSLFFLPVIRAGVQEVAELYRFDSRLERLFQSSRSMKQARATMNGLVIFVIFGSIVIVLWQGVENMKSGELTGGNLTLFVSFFILAAFSTASLTGVYSEVVRAYASIQRVMDFLDQAKSNEPSVDEPFKPMEIIDGSIEFRNVSFKYPNSNSYAIENVSFLIDSKEKVAIVGRSGAGKSTLLRLVLKFYEPTEGNILIDKVDIANLDARAVRSVLATVFQDANLLPFSVKENISFTRPGSSDHEIEQAAKIADAHDFIMLFKEKYEEQIREGGKNLSGGQKQRLTIARAILEDSKILLLDEPTSSLDSVTEAKIQQSFEALSKDRTTVTIAHRLSTVVRSDRILVISDGRLTGIGSHEELLSTSGEYTNLLKNQLGS